LLLRCTRSFYGAEDLALTEKLESELSGILLWALDGLDRLIARGHFVQPQSGRSALDEFDALGSPIAAFVSEACELDAEHLAQPRELFAAWTKWCVHTGHRPGNVQTFGRDLHAAVPSLSVVQPRDPATGQPVRHYAGLRLRTAYDARFET
jgi:putative DNA primase/helicase